MLCLSLRCSLALEVDGSGNVYCAGYVQNGGSVEGQTSFGRSDLFLMKFNANGGLIWTVQHGTAQDEMVYAMLARGAGWVAVASLQQLVSISRHRLLKGFRLSPVVRSCRPT